MKSFDRKTQPDDASEDDESAEMKAHDKLIKQGINTNDYLH